MSGKKEIRREYRAGDDAKERSEREEKTFRERREEGDKPVNLAKQ